MRRGTSSAWSFQALANSMPGSSTRSASTPAVGVHGQASPPPPPPPPPQHTGPEADAASLEAQEGGYEEGLPYLRGMPEAFVHCADVKLVVGGRHLPVHSQLLASKSAFFAGMWADIGDFEDSGAASGLSTAGRAPAHVIEKALAGRQIRDVLLFLDGVYRNVGPLCLADAKAMAALGDEYQCPDILRRCDDWLASSQGLAAARLEALTGSDGACLSSLPPLWHLRGGPDPEAWADWAIFAERAGLGSFQAKWEACIVEDWEVARKAKNLVRLSPEALLRLANGNDFRRRRGHRPPSKLLKKWRHTGSLDCDQ